MSCRFRFFFSGVVTVLEFNLIPYSFVTSWYFQHLLFAARRRWMNIRLTNQAELGMALDHDAQIARVYR
jgi:hypothetical protein